MKFLFGSLMVYAGLLFFVIGTLWRLRRWMKSEVPFSLTLFPLSGSTMGKMRSLTRETFLFSGLYREDRSFWWLAWLFHLSLAVIIVGHIVGIFCDRQQFVLLGATPEMSRHLSLTFGGIAGCMLLVSVAVLFIRRLSDPMVQRLSPPSAFFDLVLIGAVALSGVVIYLPGFQTDIGEIRAYMRGVLHLEPTPLPDNPVFVIHFSLAVLLVLYLPFSRMFHFGGSFVIRDMYYETPPTYPSPTENSRQGSFLVKRLYPASVHGGQDKEVCP
ncbi:MAG TPA: respiratory nitrate reductase subunit gamma [Geobacteraceae bacterium]|nr:respiratory nitrate reductase subunit gamma [Geobacteraceae bacterium]